MVLYGGKLLASGNQVRFWTRTAAQADLLSHNGITIVEQDEEIHILPDQIQAKPISKLTDTWKNTPGEWLLLMVKQTSIDDFIDEISPLQDHVLNVACFQKWDGPSYKTSSSFAKVASV